MAADEIERLRSKFDYLQKKQGRSPASLLINAKDIKLLSEFAMHPLFDRMLGVIMASSGREEVDFDGFVKVCCGSYLRLDIELLQS